MPTKIDITGQRFGRLTAVSKAVPRKGRTFWVFSCDCGVSKEIDSAHVRYGRIVSCGCYLAEILPEIARAGIAKIAGIANRVHGRSNTPVYAVWKTMRQRCTNPKNFDYRYYGAKGVKVCDRWNDFQAFLADMGERPEGMTIERRDPFGDYEPGNCYWASWEVQRSNRRRNANDPIAE